MRGFAFVVAVRPLSSVAIRAVVAIVAVRPSVAMLAVLAGPRVAVMVMS
jgi:hypothetical protein